MSWIKTYTGKRFDYENLDINNVVIQDIGHSLANLCRFTGHCKFYSVAQHSVHVAELVSPELKLTALLHDATEAYVKDLPRPLKRLDLSTEYRKLEENVAFLVAKKFGTQYPFVNSIHDADNAMLRAEGQLLMGGVEDWVLPTTPYDDTAYELLNTNTFWTPEKAKRVFLDRFYEYTEPKQHATV